MPTRAVRRWAMRLAISAGLLAVVTYRERHERYSCHLCRGKLAVSTVSVLAWDVRHRETLAPGHKTPPAHAHDWWLYSTHYRNGPWGLLGEGVGCKTDAMYKDSDGA